MLDRHENPQSNLARRPENLWAQYIEHRMEEIAGGIRCSSRSTAFFQPHTTSLRSPVSPPIKNATPLHSAADTASRTPQQSCRWNRSIDLANKNPFELVLGDTIQGNIQTGWSVRQAPLFWFTPHAAKIQLFISWVLLTNHCTSFSPFSER